MRQTRILPAVLAAVTLAAGALPAAAQQRVDERIPASRETPVEVSVITGSIRVTGQDRGDVHVTGQIGRGERVEVEREGGRIVVRVVPRAGQHRGSETELDVRVPARASVTVRAMSGAVQTAGVAGRVEASTVSGNVAVRAGGGDVVAESRSGNVTIEGTADDLRASSVSGTVRVAARVTGRFEGNSMSGDVICEQGAEDPVVNSVSGTIRLANVTGRVQANTVSGDVMVSGERLDGAINSVSGDVTVRATPDPRGSLTIGSHSGDVTLQLGRSGARILYTTHSGDLASGLRTRTERRSRREMEITVGDGGPRIQVSTFSGDLRLAP